MAGTIITPQPAKLPVGFVEADITAIKRQMVINIQGPEKSGKALALDTLLPTPEGWSTMGAIQEGDYLFDMDGALCKVTGTTPVMYGRACYRVTFSDGSQIVADSDHRWLAHHINRMSLGVVTTNQMRESGLYRADGKARAWRIPVARALKIPEIQLPVDPYVFGAWLGDGTSLGQGITCNDPEIIEEIAQHENVARWKSTGRTPTYSVGVRAASPFLTRLRALGVVGNKHIPIQYLRSAYHQRLSLLQGLMDTDGYISDGGECEFTTKYPALLESFRGLLASLGIKSSWSAKVGTIQKRPVGLYARVRFHVPSDVPVFRLPRKLAKQRVRVNRIARSTNRHIVAIDPVDSVPVRCISVDSPSHTYLAGDQMIPTHNTDWPLRTGPEPVFHMVLDPNGRRIHERIKRETGRRMYVFDLPYSRGLDRKESFQLWAQFKEAVESALGYGEGTLVIDSGTEMYELGRLATMGKLSGEVPFNYGEINGQLKDLYRSFYGSNLTVVVIHKLRDEWVGKTSTGNKILNGWNDTAYEVQANLDFAYQHDNTDAKFWVYVRNNNLAMDMSTNWYGVDGAEMMTLDYFLGISTGV